MKYAYFNPIIVAVEDVPMDVFGTLKNLVANAHIHSELNDEGDPSISVRGGQQIQLLPNELGLDISILEQYVLKISNDYIANLEKQTSLKIPYQPVLVSAWTIKQTSGDYQVLHSHEAHLSGNIYIDVPTLDENARNTDACIEFRFPTLKHPDRFVFHDHWKFTPEIAKMVVFPGYLPHTVYPWNAPGERVILAWDVKFIAKNS